MDCNRSHLRCTANFPLRLTGGAPMRHDRCNRLQVDCYRRDDHCLIIRRRSTATGCGISSESRRTGMGYSATDHPRIGWIGPGRRGFQLAARLLAGGHDVAVYNRTRAKAEPLVKLGASVVDSPAELADRDVVFVMVSASADLEAVTTGEGGGLTAPGVAPGLVVGASRVSTEASATARAAPAEVGTGFLAA